MSEKNGINRRKAIKITGGAVAGIGSLSSTVLASNETDTIGMREAGVVDEYQKLCDQYKFEEARQLLAEHNVEFTTRQYTRENSSDDSVSTSDWYGKGASSATFDTGLLNSDTQEYVLTLEWDLRNNKQFDPDLPQPKDKAAMGYRPDSFRYVDDSLSHSGRIRIPEKDSTIEDVTETVQEPPLGTNSGAVVSFDDRVQGENLKGDGYMQIRIKRDPDGSPGVVGGIYSHAWSVGGLGGTPFTQTITISGGSFSVATDTGVDNWTLPGQDDRDQTL